MNSRCCNKPAIKQYAGNYFCSECISICRVKPTKKFYIFLFLGIIMLININSYAPETGICKVFSIESIYTNYEIDPLSIELIESNGNVRAISICDARGLMQLTYSVVDEYNKFNNKKITKAELFNPSINREIAKWYLEQRIPQLLQSKNLEVNICNILICYNAGISYAVKYNKSKNINDLPKETQNYLIKYITLM